MVAYGALGAYAFWLYAFGPAVALLRTQLGVSYTLVGVYSAVWALGATVAGSVFAPLGRRVARRRLLWAAALVTGLGAAGFVAAQDVAVTLLAALVMGAAGTTVQLATQAVLSDRHGDRRDRALVESNIGAGACAVVAPLALGVLAGSPAGWRSAMALPAVAFAALYLAYRHQPLPALAPPVPGVKRRRVRLSGACWALCLLVGIGIAVEFCVVYFGAELLSADTHLPAAGAATALTGFYAGILAGRLAGARLLGGPGRAGAVLWVSLAVTLGGLIVVWAASGVAVGVAGLFVAGVGIANLFPLSLALALDAAGAATDTAGAATDTANGAAQLLGGLAVMVAPLVLGVAADHTSLGIAFAVAPLLTVVCAALLLTGTHPHRPTRRHPS